MGQNQPNRRTSFHLPDRRRYVDKGELQALFGAANAFACGTSSLEDGELAKVIGDRKTTKEVR